MCVCVCVRGVCVCVWGGGGGGAGRGGVEAKSKLGERRLSMTLAKRYFQGHDYFSLLTQNSANSLSIVHADTEIIYRASCKESIWAIYTILMSCK